MHEEVMTSKDACIFLKCSKSFLYKLTQQGSIPAVKLGRHWQRRKEKS